MAEAVQMGDDIDALLDANLDDLEDMPEFKPFPAGVHRCTVSFEEKKINDYPAIEVKLKAIETAELPAGSTDAPLVAGAETSSAYFLKHKDPMVASLGQGKLKEILKGIAPAFPGMTSSRALMAAAKGAEVLVATGIRQSKDKTKSYTDIVSMIPA